MTSFMKDWHSELPSIPRISSQINIFDKISGTKFLVLICLFIIGKHRRLKENIKFISLFVTIQALISVLRIPIDMKGPFFVSGAKT